MPETNGERVHIPGISPTASLDGKKRRQQPQQARQLLSCTKCRERKVKCDRTKPCSACCARGQPKLCEFVADGGDYAPIQQSYEIRKLRAENQRLKARLRDCNLPIDDDDSDPVGSPDSFLGERPGSSQKRLTSKQKRFQGLDWQDSIYFGSPGLANVITDFASLNTTTTPASLAYLLPRGCDMYTPKSPPPYPFPTVFPASPEECIEKLLLCLPEHEAILECFTGFENRVNICSFPHVPLEVTRSEVERFLADDKRNAHLCPEMLALLFAALALVGQHNLWQSSGNKWDADIVSVESRKGDVYIAAAMQALRLASFMHKPSLLSIQALIMIAPYLTNSGRFLDAWTLFGTIIRSAHAIGLHRHPKYLDPAPPSQRECSVRQTIWWWILHMDQQYSMTLGRPLGISGIGDCPPPHALTTDPNILRFGEFVNQFTLLARQILSSDRTTNTKIDEYTDELRGLLETMPEILQFDRSWLMDSKEIPDNSLSIMAAVYHCKTHTYLILLNRQRMEKPSTPTRSAETRSPITKFRSINRTHSSHSSPGVSSTNFLRGRSLVIASAAEVLDAFLFLYLRVQAALVSWDIAQQAFSACIILLIDALELRTTTPGAIKVEKAYIVFQELQVVHKLAASAVERISWGINELHKVTQKQNEAHISHDHSVRDSDESEAKSKSTIRSMYEDTVMNGTGMMLLEDPGLQGFVSESFAPVQWQAIHSERLRSAHPKDERKSVLNERKSLNAQSRSSTEDVREARSAEPMQDIRRSTTARSAPTSTTTTPLGDLTPHGSTGYMPHTTSLQTESHHQKSKATKAHKPSLCRNPPHSQHEAVHHPSNTSNLHRSVISVSADNSDEGPGAYMNQHLFAATQLRHNSCPSIPFQPTASIPPGPTHATSCAMDVHDPTVLDFQPPVSNFPENPVSMTAYEQLTATLDDPDLHRLWGVTPAAWPDRPPSAVPSQSIITPQAGANVSEAMITSDRQRTSGHTFLSQGSRIAASASVPEGQYVSMGEWTGWDNGSGAG